MSNGCSTANNATAKDAIAAVVVVAVVVVVVAVAVVLVVVVVGAAAAAAAVAAAVVAAAEVAVRAGNKASLVGFSRGDLQHAGSCSCRTDRTLSKGQKISNSKPMNSSPGQVAGWFGLFRTVPERSQHPSTRWNMFPQHPKILSG